MSVFFLDPMLSKKAEKIKNNIDYVIPNLLHPYTFN